jgi:hypothetical protein
MPNPRFLSMLAIGGLALAGCQADRQTFDEGATMETPPTVEQAPATPIPPQPFPDRVERTDTTLPPVDPDTITAEDIRPPATPRQ